MAILCFSVTIDFCFDFLEGVSESCEGQLIFFLHQSANVKIDKNVTES